MSILKVPPKSVMFLLSLDCIPLFCQPMHHIPSCEILVLLVQGDMQARLKESNINTLDAYIREQIVMRINPEENRVCEVESDIWKPLINSAAKVTCGFM